MNPQTNAQDEPKETNGYFLHAHSKRFYPWGLYSDFVHHPDPTGSDMFAGFDEIDIALSPTQGLAIKGFILLMLVVIAWVTVTI